MKGLPLLFVAALLMLGGSWRVVAAGGIDTLAATLLAAGLITLGVWLRDTTRDDTGGSRP